MKFCILENVVKSMFTEQFCRNFMLIENFVKNFVFIQVSSKYFLSISKFYIYRKFSRFLYPTPTLWAGYY